MLLRPQLPPKADATVLAISATLPASGADGRGLMADQHGLWPCLTITSMAFMNAAGVGAGCDAPCAAPERTDLALCATARSANDELFFKHFRSATVLGKRDPRFTGRRRGG